MIRWLRTITALDFPLFPLLLRIGLIFPKIKIYMREPDIGISTVIIVDRPLRSRRPSGLIPIGTRPSPCSTAHTATRVRDRTLSFVMM